MPNYERGLPITREYSIIYVVTFVTLLSPHSNYENKIIHGKCDLTFSNRLLCIKFFRCFAEHIDPDEQIGFEVLHGASLSGDLVESDLEFDFSDEPHIPAYHIILDKKKGYTYSHI